MSKPPVVNPAAADPLPWPACRLKMKSTITGTARLRISERGVLNHTVKSARNSDPKIRPRGGRVAASVVSVTDFTSRQSDEDVFEGYGTTGDRFHARVVLVGLDEVFWRVGREDRAMVDDRDAVTHRLRLFHRVGGEQDAAAAPPQLLDAV